MLEKITRKFLEIKNNQDPESPLIKIILIIGTGVISFFPFYAVIKKLPQSIGDQPRLVAGIYLFNFLIILLIVILLYKTRRKD